MVNLARRSRRKSVREDMVPGERSGRRVGPSGAAYRVCRDRMAPGRRRPAFGEPAARDRLPAPPRRRPAGRGRPMNRAGSLDLFRGDEDSPAESKGDDARNRDLARELVAFLNLVGGVAPLGVENDGGISSTTRDSLEDWVGERPAKADGLDGPAEAFSCRTQTSCFAPRNRPVRPRPLRGYAPPACRRAERTLGIFGIALAARYRNERRKKRQMTNRRKWL